MSQPLVNKPWTCVNEYCDCVLGYVTGGEFIPEDYSATLLETRGPNLVVTCPECGTKKVWFTADPVTRSIYQLTEAFAVNAARRAINIINKEFDK